MSDLPQYNLQHRVVYTIMCSDFGLLTSCYFNKFLTKGTNKKTEKIIILYPLCAPLRIAPVIIVIQTHHCSITQSSICVYDLSSIYILLLDIYIHIRAFYKSSTSRCWLLLYCWTSVCLCILIFNYSERRMGCRMCLRRLT